MFPPKSKGTSGMSQSGYDSQADSRPKLAKAWLPSRSCPSKVGLHALPATHGGCIHLSWTCLKGWLLLEGQFGSPLPTTVPVGSSKHTAAFWVGLAHRLDAKLKHQNKQTFFFFKVFSNSPCGWLHKTGPEHAVGKTGGLSMTALFTANPQPWGGHLE